MQRSAIFGLAMVTIGTFIGSMNETQAGIVRTSVEHEVVAGSETDRTEDKDFEGQITAEGGDNSATSTISRTDSATKVCFDLSSVENGEALVSGEEKFDLVDFEEPVPYRVGITIADGELSFVEFYLREDGGATIFSYFSESDLVGPDFEFSFTSLLGNGSYIWGYNAGIFGLGNAIGCFESGVIPEPSSFAVISLLAGAGLMVAWFRRKRKQAPG